MSHVHFDLEAAEREYRAMQERLRAHPPPEGTSAAGLEFARLQDDLAETKIQAVLWGMRVANASADTRIALRALGIVVAQIIFNFARNIEGDIDESLGVVLDCMSNSLEDLVEDRETEGTISEEFSFGATPGGRA